MSDFLEQLFCTNEVKDFVTLYKEAEEKYGNQEEFLKEVAAYLPVRLYEHHYDGTVPHSFFGLMSASHYERSRALCLEIEDRRGQGHVLQNLGELAEREGDLEEAKRLYGEALGLHSESGFQFGVAGCLRSLGQLLAAAGRPEEAAAHFDQALELARDLKSPSATLAAAVLRALLPGGDVQAALDALDEFGAHVGVQEQIDSHFALWKTTSDRRHLEEAHRLLERMRDHAPEEYRTSMIENVALHRDIMKAWEEHGEKR